MTDFDVIKYNIARFLIHNGFRLMPSCPYKTLALRVLYDLNDDIKIAMKNKNFDDLVNKYCRKQGEE